MFVGDVYNIAWSGNSSKWLLAGTAAGLVGWQVGTVYSVYSVLYFVAGMSTKVCTVVYTVH